MIKQFYHCGLYRYQLMIVGTRWFTPKYVMVSLDCNTAGASSASSSRITIRGTVAKICLQNTVARCSDFEMFLTNGLWRNSQQGKDVKTNLHTHAQACMHACIHTHVNQPLTRESETNTTTRLERGNINPSKQSSKGSYNCWLCCKFYVAWYIWGFNRVQAQLSSLPCTGSGHSQTMHAANNMQAKFQRTKVRILTGAPKKKLWVFPSQ